MHSIKVSPVFLSTIFLLLSSLTTAEHFKKVINEFQENVSLKPSDVFQCEVTKTNLDETSNSYNVFTQPCTHGIQCYVYQEVSEKKCFSFKVRTLKEAHIIFGNTPITSAGNVEIRLEGGQKSYIRERTTAANVKYLRDLVITGIVNDREYRGFWVRWADDELLEIGRENETVPFLHHRFPRKLQINYFGILSWTVPAAWIIDKDPKCPSTSTGGSNGTEVSKKMRVESECVILK